MDSTRKYILLSIALISVLAFCVIYFCVDSNKSPLHGTFVSSLEHGMSMTQFALSLDERRHVFHLEEGSSLLDQGSWSGVYENIYILSSSVTNRANVFVRRDNDTIFWIDEEFTVRLLFRISDYPTRVIEI